MRREHRDTRCSHLRGHTAAGQVKNKVQVVNHQIQYHRYVGAPRLEGSQALTLDVPGAVQKRLRCSKRPVVPLDMADLQLNTPAAGGGDQTVGLVERRGERL